MDRRIFARNGLGLFAGVSALFVGSARAENKMEKPHRVAIQISTEDRKTQELALSNAHNYAAYYKAKGERFAIEIVAFGPGYNMFRDDISMVKGGIEALQKNLGDAITFSACQNTRRAIAESMGQQPEKVPQISGVKNAQSGIVRLAELQEQGWAYVRP